MTRGKTMAALRNFATGVSMITSDGPHGQNVMAVEWTMQISYNPTLIAIFIHEDSSTFQNIRKTRQFGVNVASNNQDTLVSIAGGYSRRELDKIQIQDSFKIRKAKKIKPPLISGCVLNAECSLVEIKKFGDHMMVVGKVVSLSHDESKKPLLYHKRRYFQIGHMIETRRKTIRCDKKTFEFFYRLARGTFILKLTGVMVRSRHGVLVSRHDADSISTIPFVKPKQYENYESLLRRFLERKRFPVHILGNPYLKRLALTNNDRTIRINLVLFDGILQNQDDSNFSWNSIKKDVFLRSLSR